MKRLVWIIVLADLASFWLAVVLAFQLRFTSGLIPIFRSLQDISLYLKTVILLSPFYLFLMSAMGNYRVGHAKLSQYEAQNVLRSILLFYLISLACTFLIRNRELSRITVVLAFFLHIACCLAFREAISNWQVRRWRQGRDRLRLLVLAQKQSFLDQVVHAVQESPEKKYEIIGAIVIGQDPTASIPYDKTDRILIAGGDLPFSRVADVVLDAPPRVSIDFIPTYYLFLRNFPTRELIGTFPVLPISQQMISNWSSFTKRLMDVSIASVGLMLLAPLMALTGICIRLSYGKPALFRQQRVGQNGRLFTMYKFRTMKVDAEKEISPLIAEQKRTIFKWKDDPRVENSFARFLRRTGIDELPQLWNVLQGSMSLVGPRPDRLELIRNYTPEHKLRLAFPPGITGLQQINCRGTESMEEILKYDIKYMEEQSFWLDLLILLKTIPVLLFRRGTE